MNTDRHGCELMRQGGPPACSISDLCSTVIICLKLLFLVDVVSQGQGRAHERSSFDTSSSAALSPLRMQSGIPAPV